MKLYHILIVGMIIVAGTSFTIEPSSLSYGQTQTNNTSSEQTSIATDGEVQSLGVETDATIATVGTGIAGGIVAEVLARRKKDSKVDIALKEKDRLIDDLYDCIYMLTNTGASQANKEATYYNIVNTKAFPENNIDDTTIAKYIDNRRKAYKEWYRKRYLENPE